jgi:hypothetical protein
MRAPNAIDDLTGGVWLWLSIGARLGCMKADSGGLHFRERIEQIEADNPPSPGDAAKVCSGDTSPNVA